MDLMTALAAIPGIGPWLPYIVLAVTLAAAVATQMPAPGPADGGFYKMTYGILQWVALNKGHATNATAPGKNPSAT